MSIPDVQPATLVRYVLICGLENSSGLEVDDAGAMVGQGTISNHKRQLEIPGSGGGSIYSNMSYLLYCRVLKLNGIASP